jgi:hypothetical protein
MKYGNCLIGLIVILFTIQERGRIIIQKSKHGFVPHLLFRTNKGRIYHYRLVKDVLPHPLCYLVFQGEFHDYLR